MSNLYQDAILDAKALRASAMANAKAALEEAFEPKIQEMISKHLAEEAEEVEESYDMEEEGKMKHEESADINEQELEEILSQLEELEKPKEESLNEAEEEGEEEETEEEEEGEDAAEGEEVSDETKVIDITLGDLKQVIQSLMPGEAMPAAEEPTADSEADAEVSLEEILDELSMEEGAEEVHKIDYVGGGYEHGVQHPNPGEEEEMEEAKTKDKETKLGHKGAALHASKKQTGYNHELEEGAIAESDATVALSVISSLIAIPSIAAFLTNKFGKEFVADLKKGGGVALKGQPLDTRQPGEPQKEGVIAESDATVALSVISSLIAIPSVAAYFVNKYGKGFVDDLKKGGGVALKGQPLDTRQVGEPQKELAQAKSTIAELRKDLQEVNLLNAKYLYMNKLFKSKALNETQKVKVINALDRAATVVEVKNIYETLKESFEKKQPIKESIGFASKPAGVAPKANIMEADQFVSRWQKLAGIK